MLNALVAAAIILACTFALTRVAESQSSSRVARGLPSPTSQILERLPVTLELLGASMLLALIIGMGLAFIVARARGRIAKRLLPGFVLALRCIPFFWLAMVSQLLVIIYAGNWIFGPMSSNHFSLTDRLVHLAVPACILALAQIPIVVQALEAAVSPSSQKRSAPFSNALDALAVRLPEIVYLNQDSRRSLRRLAEECAERGVKASVPTLKRWSVRYGWQKLAADHDRATNAASMASNLNLSVEASLNPYRLIELAKNRVYSLIDPTNANVSPAQRRRAKCPTVSDYCRLVKLEMALYDRLERLKAAGSAEPESPAGTYADEELHVMMRALAQYRHGLPGA
jgi:hypothetical protein